MKRLTEKEQDYYRLKDYQDPCKAIDQLGRYEDIGFSPEELQELIDKQKWHVVAEGDLPEEKGFYQCTVLDNQKNEVFVADVYNETTGFFSNNELYEVIATYDRTGICEAENFKDVIPDDSVREELVSE